MPGEESHLSRLESRKLRLIAESDSNRVLLSGEWHAMARSTRALGQRVKSVGTWASSAALVLAGIAAWRRSSPATGTPIKASWLQRILDGVRLATTLYCAVRTGSGRKRPSNSNPGQGQNRAATDGNCDA